VLAVTAAVVRLVGSLGHRDLPQSSRSNETRPGGSRSIAEVLHAGPVAGDRLDGFDARESVTRGPSDGAVGKTAVL
jgi:hypothetical protein